MFFSKLQKRDEAKNIANNKDFINITDYKVLIPMISDLHVTSHLSLLPSGKGSQGISTNRPSPLSTASHWMVRETVGWLLKCSIRGRPAPAGSSVTVNFLSYNDKQIHQRKSEKQISQSFKETPFYTNTSLHDLVAMCESTTYVPFE